MFKITHETKHKYFIRRIDLIDEDIIDIAEQLCEVEIVFDPDTLMKDVNIIDKRIVDNTEHYKSFTYNEVKDATFKFYQISADSKVTYLFIERVQTAES